MTPSSPTPNSLLTLIRHAQRNMAYIRNQRGSYANPKYWANQQRTRAVDAAVKAPADLRRVDRSQTTLAARWAVADARRRDNPALAQRLDRDVQRHGLSATELRAAQWNNYERGWQDARHRHEARQPNPNDRGTMMDAGVPIAAGLVVSAALYANAADWDTVSNEHIEAADAQWSDPVPEAGQAEVEPPAETAPSAEHATVPVEQDVADGAGVEYQAAELPEGFWGYTLDEQMAHVAEHGGGSVAEGPEGGVDVGAGAEVAADAGMGVGA